MLHRAVLSIFRKPTGWENESMISAIPVESFFSAFIFHFSFMLEISLLNCLWQFFYASGEKYLSFLGVAPKTGKNYTKSVAAGRSHANTAKNVRKWWCCKLLFFTWNMWKQEVFEYPWEGKQTREICRYSILNSEPGACNSWWVCNWVHFLCVILTSNLSLHSLCWLLSYKEKWEVRWQEMQPLKLTFHSCFCHKRTKTLWDITP